MVWRMTIAHELRFAFVVDGYEAAVRLFRDVLGLEVENEFAQQGGRGMILRVPAATLELFDVAYGDYVDEVEVGRRLGERVRIAVKVSDLDRAGDAVAAAGAEPVADAVDTPWGDRNRRYATADGLQLALFQDS
jgi:lactoylglutathione lyase